MRSGARMRIDRPVRGLDLRKKERHRLNGRTGRTGSPARLVDGNVADLGGVVTQQRVGNDVAGRIDVDVEVDEVGLVHAGRLILRGA